MHVCVLAGGVPETSITITQTRFADSKSKQESKGEECVCVWKEEMAHGLVMRPPQEVCGVEVE